MRVHFSTLFDGNLVFGFQPLSFLINPTGPEPCGPCLQCQPWGNPRPWLCSYFDLPSSDLTWHGEIQSFWLYKWQKFQWLFQVLATVLVAVH